MFWRIHVLSTVLSLDVMDISGETQSDVSHNILKARLDEKGVPVPNSHTTELRNDIDKLNEQRQSGYCGSCYGGVEPEGGCCNTCDQVRQAYVTRGWSFSSPDSVEQVRKAASRVTAQYSRLTLFLLSLSSSYLLWE